MTNHFTTENFFEKAQPIPETGCLLWMGHTTKPGYCQVKSENKRLLVHRIAWELTFGPIPKGFFVLHIGTHIYNKKDAMNKSRHARGESYGRSKLKPQDVLEIRCDSRPQSVIAQDYGVHQYTISCIKTKRSWAHV